MLLSPTRGSSSLITCWSTCYIHHTGEAIYLEQAQLYLGSLLFTASYYDPDATDGWQSILRRSSARWSDPEVGAVFADYFLLESMVSYATRVWVQ